MLALRTLPVAILTVSLATAVSAQSLRSVDGPAEVPPPGYSGKQYVDSKGCVFIRAGYDGAVTWVPRVDRKRKVVCGASPTVVSGPTVAAPPPPSVAVLGPPSTATPPPSYAAAPPVVAPVPTYAPPPTVVASVPYHPAPSPHYAGVTYPGWHPGHKQGVLHIPQSPVIAPPPGYKPAFDDGRFNPYRGQGTQMGEIQMALVWTDGVPRHLVGPSTAKYKVVNGVPTPDREYILNSPNYYHAAPTPGYTYTPGHAPWLSKPQTTGLGYVVSTKGEEPPVATSSVTVPDGHRFVQVGLFSTDAKAGAAANRLQAVGLPVQIKSVRHGGKAYRMVLAGPFNAPHRLANGLNIVHGIGYTGAKTR